MCSESHFKNCQINPRYPHNFDPKWDCGFMYGKSLGVEWLLFYYQNWISTAHSLGKGGGGGVDNLRPTQINITPTDCE